MVKTLHSRDDWELWTNKSCINRLENHLFKVSTSQYFSKIIHLYKQILSKDELYKASRYFHQKDRETFIVTRYFLRTVLPTFITNLKTSEIQFHYSGNKKPAIDGIEFNVSHSGDYVFIAVSPNPIGIDIESIDSKFDYPPMLNELFNIEEQFFITSGKNKPLNFYALWTRKEAILKASGEGLIDQLNELNVLNEYITRNEMNYKLDTFNLDDMKYVFTLALSNMQLTKFWRNC
ncbi:4'-phosphopantetheinyl transferase family protein [Pedobacter nyackensis]|uniref:4'-phosphopantetheinyl transferase family protein n=1 Tax=Pedobacter nyackensis TaxID=475255 RepID=UPI00292F4FB0|nr:4'-phosphopantetheinyl transferase superfamily protein [Pedobacter nyackensis]